jgi:hypothetical protein
MVALCATGRFEPRLSMGGLDPPIQGNKRCHMGLWMAGSKPAMVSC